MHSFLVALSAAGLATFAQAYTKPTTNSWGPLLTPDLSQSVTQGKEFKVTWDPESHPTEGVTVSLVLCHGPSSNCVPQDTAIASGIPAAQKSFDWSVPCSLAPGTQNTDTGYGMLIIVDGTGEFQYSTQFSCLENKACASSSSTSSSNSTTSNATTTATTTGSASSKQTSTTSVGSVNGTTTYHASVTPTGTTSASSATDTFGAGSGSGSTLTSWVTAATSAGSTGTASGAVTTPSTFPGSAPQLKWDAAGVLVAGAAAWFML
ncbi:hypothetical protein ABEF93_005729 [Exophiala dermatitidis]